MHLKFTRKKVPQIHMMKTIWLLMKVKVNVKGHLQNETEGDDTEYGDTEDTDEATAESGSE